MVSLEVVVLLVSLLGSRLTSGVNNLNAKEMLKILKEAESKFDAAVDENITLILGTYDADKEDIVSFIYNRRTNIDRNKDIPDMIVGRKTGMVIFDYPPFLRTRDGSSLTSQQMLYHKMITKLAGSVRYILLMPYDPYEGRFENKLKALIRHASNLIPNVTKFQSNVGLIFTKVNYKNELRGDVSELIPRDELVEEVREKTEGVFRSLRKGNWEKGGFPNPERFKETLRFLSMILLKPSGSTGKITTVGTAQTRTVIKEWFYLREFISHIPFSKPIVQQIDTETYKTIDTVSQEINEGVKSSIENLGSEMIKSTMIEDNTRDLDKDYMNFKKTRQIFIELKEKKVESIGEVVRNIAYTLKENNMKEFASFLRPALEHKQVMDELESFTGTSLTNSSEMLEGFDGLINHLELLEKWTFFMKSLYAYLPLYIVEYNLNVDNVIQNMYPYLISFEPNVKIKVKDLGFDAIIDLISSRRRKREQTPTIAEALQQAYAPVMDKEIDKQSAWSLINDLRAMKYTTTHIEREKILEIKGLVLNASEVLEYIRAHNLKHVEVYAFNRFLLNTDMDLSKNVSSLAIYAKNWVISGDRYIALNGTDGKDLTEPAWNKSHGLPGLPGNPAGHFLGVAEKVTEGRLTIYACGGRGGKGQDGANGTQGKDGQFPKGLNIPRFSKNAQHWPKYCKRLFPEEDGKTFYNITYRRDLCIMDEWNFHGTPGQVGEAGYDGGKGGEGGKEGNVSFIDLGNSLQINIKNKKGTKGSAGKGGRGGEGGLHANTVVIRCCSIIVGYVCSEHEDLGVIQRPLRAQVGKNGKRGKNVQGMRFPQPSAEYEPSKTINRLKAVVREFMTLCKNKGDLETFILSLEKNKDVRQFYDAFSLMDDLKCIEEQFPKLHESINLTCYYESLLDRTGVFENGDHEKDLKLALTYLKTATISRLQSTKYNKHSLMIVDVQYFLAKLIQDIKVIEKIGKQLKNDQVEKKNREELENQIKDGEHTLQNILIPRIGAIMKNIAKLINKTMNEVRQGRLAQSVSVQQQRDQIEHPTVFQKVMSFVNKVVDVFKKIFGAFKSVVNVGQQMKSMLGNLPQGGNSGLSNIATDIFSGALGNFNNKLIAGKNILSTFIDSFKDKLPGINSFSNILSFFDDAFRDFKAVPSFHEFWSKKDEFMKGLDDAMNKLIENGGIQGHILKSLRRTNDELKNVLHLPLESYQVYKALLDNDIKPGFKKNMENVQNAEDKAELAMHNIVNGLQTEISTSIMQLGNESPMGAALVAGNMKAAVKEVGFQLKSALNNLPSAEPIAAEFNALEAVLDEVVSIHDKMGYYQNQKRVNTLTANLESSKNLWDPSDSKVFHAINDLKFTMKASNLLVQHKRALHGIKQYIFPFADHFLEEFSSLPPLKLTDDFKDILKTIIPQIKKLYSTIDDWSTGINHHDAYIFKDALFTHHDYLPFYTFPYTTFNSTIISILSGKEETIIADVRKSLKKEAIKFNKIGIYFQLLDSSKQEKFDEALRNYDVDMLHYGINMFRCDKKYFKINSEKQLISYSFERNEKDEPLRSNSVYDKLASSEYFLSPYGLWIIKLRNVRNKTDLLEAFRNEPMNLHLEGRAQYLEPNRHLEQICGGTLETHYSQFQEDQEIDEIIIKATK